MTKVLNIRDVRDLEAKVPDADVIGDGDTFQMICKTSSEAGEWMKSTKAMEIPGVGCVIQVTTQQCHQIAEALVFVPGVRISTGEHGIRKIVAA